MGNPKSLLHINSWATTTSVVGYFFVVLFLAIFSELLPSLSERSRYSEATVNWSGLWLESVC